MKSKLFVILLMLLPLAAKADSGEFDYSELHSYLYDITQLVPTDSYFIVGDGTDWIREASNTARASLGITANMIIDWTSCANDVNTTGFGRFGGGIGVGADPTATSFLIISKEVDNPLRITIDNTGTGDSVIDFRIGGDLYWAIGVDQSDNHNFKIGTDFPGVRDVLEIDFITGAFNFKTNPITAGPYNGVMFSINDLVIDDTVNDNSLTVSGDWTLDQSVASRAVGVDFADLTLTKAATNLTINNSYNTDTSGHDVILLTHNPDDANATGNPYITLRAYNSGNSPSINKRFYIRWQDVNGTNKFLTGKNANNNWILYGYSPSACHYVIITDDGETIYCSNEAYAFAINNHSEGGTGGLKVYSGSEGPTLWTTIADGDINTTGSVTAANFNIASGGDIQINSAVFVSNTGTHCLLIGLGAGEDNTGTNCIFIGDDAGGSSCTGNDNLCIGYGAGAGLTSGVRNTALGAGALETCTDGDDNFALGNNALLYCTGNDNVAIGRMAGAGVDGSNTATGNVFIGSEAGGYAALTSAASNTAVGYRAGWGLTSAISNTLVGALAGDSLTTGGRNTLIGYDAGTGLIGGSYNCLIGYKVGEDMTTGERNVFIGYLAGGDVAVGVSRSVIIGFTAGRDETDSDILVIDNIDQTSAALTLAGAPIYGWFEAHDSGPAIRINNQLGIGKSPTAGTVLDLNLSTEDLEIIDAGSTDATEQDWIEVEVGGNVGYIRVFAAK